VSVRTAYGLRCSVNFDWAWCPQSSASDANVEVVLGTLGRFDGYPASDYQPYPQRPSRNPGEASLSRFERGRDGHFRVTYSDGARFIIDSTKREIFGVATPALGQDDLIVYLQGPVLGALLRLRGVTCLHASAACVNGRAIAVVGDAGMGKSTSAAAFARLGFPVLTDDVLALTDDGRKFFVQPGLPRILLWPESVAALWGDAEALPRIVDTWDKRYLDLNSPGYQFASEPTPLGAIYILAGRVEGAADADIRAPESSIQACIQLVANTYGGRLLDAPMRAQELAVLGRIVNEIPIRMVLAPDDRSSVMRVCEDIVRDFESMNDTSRSTN